MRSAARTEPAPKSGETGENPRKQHLVRVADHVKHPGPRYRDQGRESAEELREEHLTPALRRAAADGADLVIELGGTPYGYPASYLEEALGGLVRRAGHEAVRDHVRLADASGESLSEAEEVLGAALRAAAEESSAGPDPLNDTRQRVPVWVALCYALALEDGTPTEKARGTELQKAVLGARNAVPEGDGLESLTQADSIQELARQRARERGCNPEAWPGRHVDWNAACEELQTRAAEVRWNGRSWWLTKD